MNYIALRFTKMDPIMEMLTSYQELNGSNIIELVEEPSALEFMRFVALNTPFVIRGAASEWKATNAWNCAYLREAMGNQTVTVAVTPHGFACQDI
jgi:jumonji domain-containing protein 7